MRTRKRLRIMAGDRPNRIGPSRLVTHHRCLPDIRARRQFYAKQNGL